MSDFARIREEGERISREEGYKVLLAEIAARDKEIARLRLTDAERECVEWAADWLGRWQQTHGYHSSESGDLATLRGLLERLGGGA